MSTKKYEYHFDMTCDGCLNAAKKVLLKIDVPNDAVTADMPGKKLYVQTDKSEADVTSALQKTGKAVNFIGVS